MSTPVIIADRYRVESLLGRGGMGVVYAVRDELSGERIALKQLQPEASQRMARLFELEYQTLASLDHPGIVRVFDYQRDSEGAFYTMELVQGRDLSQQAPMPWRVACACLRDVAAVLALLHTRRLVHRDLTPRNLLRTDAGRMKLIDFGSLAAFGETDDVVGTLQFMAPESLGDQAIDQRADLYSLGALGYWLLTGIHAFPARNISELEQSWQRAPAPPSTLVALLEGDFEAPPPELDDLIGNLLQLHPEDRPASTAELIDQLTSFADLEPESQSAEGYLASKAFVGRIQERERVRAAMTPAKRGQGRAILFEGVSGAGHTRLLRELGVMARLSGVLVAEADASAGLRPYGAALSLLLKLLPVLDRGSPELALLARLSPALHARVGGELPEVNASEARVRYQNALHALILRASQPRALVLLLDDLHAMDEESLALFAALAHSATHERMVVVAASKRHPVEDPPALLSFRQVAVRIRLMALSASETLELLRSLFGNVPYLERVSERVYRTSEGNPGHCLELASLLVERGLARYREGMWVLPSELSAEELPRDRKLVQKARVDRMANAARTLAAHLSVQPRDVLTFEQCMRLAALSGLDEARARALLGQLVRDGVLHESAHGYRFVHEEIAQTMYGELGEAQRVRAHRAFGELLLEQASDPLGKLRACPHFLRAGDRARGEQLALALAHSKQDVDFASVVRSAAPLCEEILALLRGYHADDYSRLEPLAILAAAGYFADHRYATRYGEEAIEVLSRVLRVRLALALARVLGGKLGLTIALMVAGVALFLHRKRAPNLTVVVMRMMAASSCLAGTAAACIDTVGTQRYARAIEPFAALGPNHACGIGHQFARAVHLQIEDRPAAAREAFVSLIARFESPVPIRDLPEDHRKPALAGCYFALGINESFREDARVLEIADKLEHFGPLFAMQADYLRATHYNGLGDHQRAAQYRQRAEVHAVHLGSAWQVDTWAQADATKLGLRAFDVLIMKQASHQLARFARHLPSLATDERRARGTYLALRGRHREALELLEVEEPPLAVIGWARARGTLAMVYNALGQHERALAVCEDVLRRLDPADLDYTVLNLGVQIEAALAKLGLGRADEARAELDALIAHHAPKQSPLTLGLLHRARFRVALRQRDFADANEQLTKLEGWYGTSGMPSLLEVARNLRRELTRTQSPFLGELGSGSHDASDPSHVIARAELLLKRETGPKRVLVVALELTGADDGFLLLAGGQVLPLGPSPSNELLGWAEHELASANDYDAEIRTEEIDSELDPYKLVGGVRYFASPLWREATTGPGLLGVLVLGFTGAPRLPDRRLLGLIATHLEQLEREAKQA
ncbi:MAG: protein kinase [Polyangiales bacterium]